MKTVSDQLMEVTPGQFLTRKDGARAQVIGRIVFTEMIERGKGNWVATDDKYLVVQLGDGKALAYFPMANEQKNIWILAVRRQVSLTEKLAPKAKEFGATGQDDQADVKFEHNGVNYQMKDIGKQRYEGTDEAFLPGKGDCRHIMAANQRKRFLYIDTEGTGADTLLLGDEVDVEEIIQSIE